jgi:hypothetical protein
LRCQAWGWVRDAARDLALYELSNYAYRRVDAILHGFWNPPPYVAVFPESKAEVGLEAWETQEPE